MQRLIVILASVGFLLSASAMPAQTASPFQVVVHSSSSASSLSQTKVSQLFLKKVTRWDSGGKVLPVDQVKKSSIRQAFSEEIHGKDVRSIDSYWQTQLFSGRATPPPELFSDAEVLSYVSSNVGAIGYVSKSATVGEGVKVLQVTG